ncbi:hypothetical protein DPEC_G00100180 [Dallia pectoralis]|uniref:Uncharacterized protein n=1 Tax=Dallia pectoralis TaxID=75939 RepID=A0ACC2GW95_DALPE|nr:hypothetical protein DPEC_G00100180 [Dallia pectoralis]
MDESTSLDVETLKITQERYILEAQTVQLHGSSCDPVYPVGLYGWRKRCLYFFLLLLLIIMIVNLALTVWIIKVMKFTVDGMGYLRMNQEAIRLDGISEFLLPFYVKEIQSRTDSPLVLRSNKNVTINARNSQGQLTAQLTVGPGAIEVQCQRFQVRTTDGEKVLFSVDEEEISIGTDHFRVAGPGGSVFGRSVETPLILADGSQDLKLESPTRTVTMEAPRGVEISAAEGKLKATCRKDLELRSTEGEIFLDANTIRLGSLLPHGVYSPHWAPRRPTVYELCVCTNGKLYLSPADSSSTCHSMSNFCLWS